MNAKFWCILCSAFLIYSLKLLFENFYSVNYKTVEDDDNLHDEVTNIAACTHSSRIVENNQNSTENPAILVKPNLVDARGFLKVSIAMIENRLNTTNLFRVDQSYLFRGFICLLLNQTAYETDQSVKNFLILYRVQLFAYSSDKQPYFYEYVYNNYFNNDSLFIRKQKVYGSQYLASTNCRTPQDRFAASKFHCLRKCAFNKPADFHPPDSRKTFNLRDLLLRSYDSSRNADYHDEAKKNLSTESHTQIINNHSAEKDSDNETFRKCLRKCPKKDCFRETYNSINQRDNNRMKIDIKTVIYRAYYSTTHFWSQLFGLLTLFTGTSVINIALLLMKQAARKLKTSHQVYFVRFLPKIKLGLIIFSSIFILAQSILMIVDYHFEKSFPNRTLIWNFSSKPFSVIICLPVETLIHNESNIKPERNSLILEDFTFEKLEKNTDAFKNGVKEIKLLHGNRIKNLSWTMTKKVLFKNSSFDGRNCLSRCFRIEPNFEDLKYRKMMPFYYLTIRFHTQFREVYLTERHQSFSSGLVNFKGEYFVRKTTERALPGSKKANCRTIKKKESTETKYIDRCINQRFLNEHSALPMNSVFDKDDFGDQTNSFKFSEANTTAIEQTCLETHQEQRSCKEVHFKESMKRLVYEGKNATMKLNLNYEDSISMEIDQSSIKVLLHILNLESIFFKNNVASCLLLLLSVLKRTFKLKWSSGKLDRFLVPSLCLLGFLTHNVFVFKGIINGELAQNSYFNSMSKFFLPNAVFCFDLSKIELDENHKMTGNYLNRFTEEFRLGNIVEKVMYFNRTHDKLFRPAKILSNYSDSELIIRPLYLLNTFYCLEFQLNVEFEEEDFYILVNKFIFQISFKPSFTRQANKTYLFYRQSEQKEVSDLLEYEMGTDEKGRDPTYEIVLELLEVGRQDEFENLKDLRRLFFGKRAADDKNWYLNEMQAKFSEFEYLTTNEILLEQSDFNKEIDNELFKQFFRQVINVADHRYPISLNSKLNYFNFYSKQIYLKGFTYFQFTILPISKKVKILNDENFAKLIQDILNTLSLWLNVSIADLIIYINLALNVLLRFYSLLVKAQNKLRSFREI